MNPSDTRVIPRIMGLAIGLIGIILLATSIYGLRSVDNTSHVLLEASRSLHQEYQQDSWKTHDTMYWGTWLTTAALAISGGVLLTMRRRSGIVLVVIGSLVVLLYPFVVQLLGQKAYTFENVNYPTAFTAAVLIVISALVYFVSFRKLAS